MITRLIGLVGIAGCLVVIFLFEGAGGGSGAFRIFHWPAMVLTGLGPFALIMVCFDAKVLGRTVQVVFGDSAETRDFRHKRGAIQLHKWGSEYYAKGPSVFEHIKTHRVSKFVQKVVERFAMRMPTNDIHDLLMTERDRRRVHMIQSLNVLNLGVRVAPSLGMLGTILGMVRLLSTLQDPTHIGSHMSLALLTTFYGLFFSLIVWTPLQQKLERVMDVELDGYDQVVSWLDILERRKPVLYFADKAEIPHEESKSRTGRAA